VSVAPAAASIASRLVEHLVNRDVSERTAVLVATMGVGRSFGPGLLPRSTVDQAALTGMTAALTYGIVATTQSLFQGVAGHLIPAPDERGTMGRHLAQGGANALMGAVGVALVKGLPARRGEPTKRAVARASGQVLQQVGVGGLAITGVLAATDLVARQWPQTLRLAALPTGLLVGSAIAVRQIARYRAEGASGLDVLPPARDPMPLPELAEQEQATVEKKLSGRLAWPPPVGTSILMGTGISAALFTLAGVETLFARLVADGTRRAIPGLSPLAPAVGHAVSLGVIGSGVVTGMEYLYRSQEQGGAAIEAAYDSEPTSEFVSGGPASVIEWTTLTREGARFVNMALRPDEIETVMGRPAATSPIRVFGGLDIAETVDQRVDITMADLERLGAFERSVICVASPTGSGYINYVAAETLEFLTLGDCAMVTMQYSLRPSFTSLDRVSMGREQNRALLHALTWRLRAIPEEARPRLVGFGESLGAHTFQDAFLHEGTAGFHRVGLDRALFLGSPGGSEWATTWRVDPDRSDPDHEVVEVATFDEWGALPTAERDSARYVLLSHHEDPIVKFGPELAVQLPDWLGSEDARVGIPPDMTWRVLSTFLTVLIDVKNAMDVKPGIFVSRGHDYRADLARFVALAYDLPMADDERLRIEEALRRRELFWAQDRLISEQLNQAREAVQRQLKSWGVSPAAAGSVQVG